MSLTKEEEQVFENALAMTRTPGWQDLMEQLEEQYVRLNRAEDVADQRELDYRKGQLLVIRTMLMHEEVTRMTLEDRQGSSDDD